MRRCRTDGGRAWWQVPLVGAPAPRVCAKSVQYTRPHATAGQAQQGRRVPTTP